MDLLYQEKPIGPLRRYPLPDPRSESQLVERYNVKHVF